MTQTQNSIAIIGRGLAGNLAALALSKSLGADWRILQLGTSDGPLEDSFYGSVTAPTAYNFLRSVGLEEPRLLLGSATTFSLGSHFKHWVGGASWVQCHHSPLPTLATAPLRHQLTRLKLDLEPLLVSAQVAKAGRFAHPPEDPNTILSRAEYGYQFDPMEWAALLDHDVADSTVERIESEVRSIETSDNGIASLALENGDVITASLYVDASGPGRQACLAVGAGFAGDRTVSATTHTAPASQIGPACQIVEATPEGWTSTTFLQNRTLRLSVSSYSETSTNGDSYLVGLGQLETAWTGNCVAIGHAAAVVEPLTPAPMMMLQRDVERLLALVPSGVSMDVERREYNRQYRDDIAHISLFLAALLKSDDMPEAGYWREAQSHQPDERLERKLAHFEHRGLLVSYDLEPFNEEDWTILHWGKGLRPRQYDRTADAMSDTEASQAVAQIRQSIEQIVPRIPPHGLYVTKLKQYLERLAHG